MGTLTRKDVLVVYTDGSSYSRPRHGGIGIRCVWLDECDEEVVQDFEEFGTDSATNNQMELQATIVGIQKAKAIRLRHQMRIEVRTDSRYVTNHVQTALNVWAGNSWCNAAGKPIDNAHLWKALLKEYLNAGCRVEFKWVKGHAKDIHNNAVDKLAKKSAKGYLNKPLHVTKVRRKKSTASTKAGTVEMKGQRLAIRIVDEQHLPEQDVMRYRYEVVSLSSAYYGLLDFIYSDDFSLRAGHTYKVIVSRSTKNPRIVRVLSEIVQ